MMNKKQLSWIAVIFTLIAMSFFLYTPDISLDEIKSRYTNGESLFTSIQGMNVHYRREGKGPTLLLIHGTAASLHTWDDWTRTLSSEFEIVRMDLPAFGITGPRPDRNYSMSNYVSFIKEFVDQQAIDTFYLAGNSLGGAIAWNYAIEYPSDVKKLVLLDPSGAPRNSDPPFIFRLANTPILSSILKKVTPRSIIESNIQQVYFDDNKITDALIDRYYHMALRAGNREAFVDRAQKRLTLPTARMKEIECPTLIQWGRHDEWIPVRDADFFQKNITNSQVIIYEKSGHVPMEEIPEVTSRDLQVFLLSE